MASFEYTKITLVGDKVDDDGQRLELFQLDPVSVESFDACNMLVFWFKSEVIGFPWKKPVFMPVNSLSW